MVEQLERRSTFTRSQEDYLKALYLLGGNERPVPTRSFGWRRGSRPATGLTTLRGSWRGPGASGANTTRASAA